MLDYPESLTAGAAPARTHRRLSARAARWLAWSLWAASVAQVALGLLLATLNHLTWRRFFAEYLVVNTAATLAFATVGLLIVARRRGNTVGWLLCATGPVWGLNVWVGQYARYALVTRPGALPAGQAIAWVNMWVGVPVLTLTAIVLPLLFPDGRLPSARWRPAAWLAASTAICFTVSQALTPGPVDASLPEVSNPFAPPAAEPALRVVWPLAIALMLASLAVGVAAAVVRFHRSSGAARQQLKWFAYATALLVVTIVAPALLDPSSIVDPTHGDSFWSGLAVSVGFAFLAAAVGIAILRYRLYDIDVIINRTLVYGALTACVVGVYVLVVGYLSALFQASGNVLISLIATGTVAVLFQPLRARLQRAVDRLIYGERDDPYAVIARLGQRLEATLAPDAVLPTIVQTVREALKLPYAAIALKQGDELVVVAEAGDGSWEMGVGGSTKSHLPSPISHLPLVYQGELLGELRLAARPGENGFGEADRRLLDDLARHAGVAVHATRLHTHALGLAADLQQSRERLVTAREEERRRLRRDLHDGLGPALAGLMLKIDAAHDQLEVDVAAAAGMLRDLKANLQEAIADIRRLVYALRPPALDELGLAAALQLQIAHYQRPALRITLDAPADLPPLPAAVEVAAYRIIAEALTNVVRHAQARRCDVRLTLGDALEIQVVDDGRGLAEERRRGGGLTSMRERAEELGGACVVEPAAGGGTRVWARLPLGL